MGGGAIGQYCGTFIETSFSRNHKFKMRNYLDHMEKVKSSKYSDLLYNCVFWMYDSATPGVHCKQNIVHPVE